MLIKYFAKKIENKSDKISKIPCKYNLYCTKRNPDPKQLQAASRKFIVRIIIQRKEMRWKAKYEGK